MSSLYSARNLLAALRHPIGAYHRLGEERNKFENASKLINRNVSGAVKDLAANEELFRNLDEMRKKSGTWFVPEHWWIGGLKWLYVITKTLKPKIAVEVGTAWGFTATVILTAMEESGLGKLYSIDFPRLAEEKHKDKGLNISIFRVPWGKTQGWLVPGNLRSRWELIQGYSTEKLGPLLRDLHEIDLFMHDGDPYESRFKDLETVWPNLSAGGAIICADIDAGPALFDFGRKVDRKVLRYLYFGGFSK